MEQFLQLSSFGNDVNAKQDNQKFHFNKVLIKSDY